MKKLIIILSLLGMVHAGFNNTLFISTKEKNNSMFVKAGMSIEYVFKHSGYGIKTASGIINPDRFVRIYYRDMGFYKRYYLKYIFAGIVYNYRFNNETFSKSKNVKKYFEIETGIILPFRSFDLRFPVAYKVELKEISMTFEFVIKYKLDNL